MSNIWYVIVYATLFLNILLIIKSFYYKNFYLFIIFSSWLILYSIQELILLYDLAIEYEVKYLNVYINHEGFQIASIFHIILLLLFLMINNKINIHSICRTKTIYICKGYCKLIYTVLFLFVISIFIIKVSGISNLILLSRPANETGLSMFLFFLVSSKIMLFATYNNKFDRVYLFLYLISLFIFMFASKLHLLMSLISVMTFLWIVNLRNMKRNIFSYKIILVILFLPLIFIVLALIKFKSNSMELILEQGLVVYFSNSFESLSEFIYLLYKIAIEGFSNFASFFSKQGLDYSPIFGINFLDFFVYFLPGSMRDYLADYSNFLNSMTNVTGNVPVTITYVFESFHVFGIVVFFIIIWLFVKVLRKCFYENNILLLLSYLIILNNSIIIIRGAPEQFISWVIYDLLGIIFLILFAKKKVLNENIN